MVESANEEFCSPQAELTFHNIKWDDKDSGDENSNEELMLLLVRIFPTQGPVIYCRNKSGESKAYKRSGDQTLLISDQD
jgi:hypothetical protein